MAILRKIISLLTLFAIGFVCFFSISESGGQDNLTLLLRKLQSTDNDSLKVVYLNQIALANINLAKNDSAISYATQALRIAEKLKNKQAQMDSYLVIGKAYKGEKKFAGALDNYNQALEKATSLGNKRFMANANVEMGFLYQDWNVFGKSEEFFDNAYELHKELGDTEQMINNLNYKALSFYRAGDLEQALKEYQKQLELANKVGNNSTAVSALRNIANIYTQFNDYESALRYNLEILDIKKALGDSLGMSTYYNNIGSIYKKLDQNSKALKSFKQALELNKTLDKDPKDNVVIMRNMGVIYQTMRDYQSALRYFKGAMGILEVEKNVKEMARTANYITTIYYGLEDYQNAITYTQKAIDLSAQEDDKEILGKSYKRMSEIYQKQKNNRKALEYFQKYAAVKDDIIELERIKQEQIKQQQLQVGKEEQQLKNRLLEQEMKSLELEKRELEADKKIKELALNLALNEKNKDIEIRNKELEVAKLEQKELQKARELQDLRLNQARLATESRARELQISEQERELESKKREIQAKELKEKEEEIGKMELSQQVKDLESQKLKGERLFYIIGLGLFVVLVAIIGVVLAQKTKSNKNLASINEELSTKNQQIEEQNKQITEQTVELERAYKDIKLIGLIGQKITASLDIEAVTKTVYEYVGSIMPTTSLGLGIYKEDAQIIDFRGAIESGETMPYHYDLLSDENSLPVWAFNRRRQIMIGDFAEDYKDYVDWRPEMRTKGIMKSAVYIPLATEKRPIGVITVQSDQKDAYSNKDLTILQTLASYISIALDNAQAYDIIKDKNKHITDSIRYAQTIQKAILPSKAKMDKVLKEHFVLYYPKDIVSGDFFWFMHIPADKLPSHIPDEERKDKTYVAVVDCTGHGVPGAFMSMIGSTLLNDIISRSDVYAPAEILEFLHSSVVNELRQRESANDDGMDVCLCLIEAEGEGKSKITYTGAKRPLYYMEKDTDTLREIKGTNKGIGGVMKKYRPFTNETVILENGSMLYLSSDGLPDQNNNDNRKLGSMKFKHTLQENSAMDMNEQKEALASVLYKHMGETPQRDDITVVGVKI
jgi:serine phosphatase RsbU (regulator of sigma subunit)